MPKSVDSRDNMGALRARNVPTKIINIINTPSSTNGITSERFITNMWVKQVIKEGGKNLLVFKMHIIFGTIIFYQREDVRKSVYLLIL